MTSNGPLLPTGHFGWRRVPGGRSPQFIIRPRGRALGVSCTMFTSAIRAMQFEDWLEIEAEFNRLSLRSDDIPGGGLAIGGDEALAQFLAHLRSLSPGATWRDVLPDLPEHWDIANPESWTFPYQPIGSFDYPRLPAGPVIMTSCGVEHDEGIVQRVIADARLAGFAIYGAGLVGEMGGETPERLIRIVMQNNTTEEQLYAFTQWIGARDDLRFDGVSRGIDERWAPESYEGS